MQNLFNVKLQALLAVLLISSNVNALERELIINYQSEAFAEKAENQITHLDLDAALAEIPEEASWNILNNPEQIQQLIETLLSREYFAEKAIETGIADDPLVEARLYQAVISTLATIYQERELQESLLSDYTQQAREIYLKNYEIYTSPGEVTFRHILINNQNPDAQNSAEELLGRIRAGEDLQELASDHSDDPSVQQNEGLFSRIPFDQLDPQFRSGIEEIEPGEINLIESSFGWHVVQVENVYEPGQLAFEDVSEQLKAQAEASHRAEIMRRLLREAYAEPLDIKEGAIADLLNRHDISD